MKNLSVDLENCYGIRKLAHTFDFENSKVQLIYAKNGTMKTSFAKVFQKIQSEKKEDLDDIKDHIFGREPVICEIKINDNAISGQNIFVISGVNEKYESKNISTLLLNENLKNKLIEVFKLKFQLFKELKIKTKLSIPKDENLVELSNLETKLLADFNLEGSFLKKLNSFNFDDFERTDFIYSDFFDSSKLEELIMSKSFQENIDNFLKKSEEIYDDESYSSFLESGKFSFIKLKDLSKSLKKNNFFVKNNEIILGKNKIKELAQLTDKKGIITEIENKLKETKEFLSISSKLGESDKGKRLLDIIEREGTFLIDKLKNYKEFRRELWLSYFSEIKTKDDDGNEINLFFLLKKKFDEFNSEITNDDLNSSDWKKALEIFNSRFEVPFKMNISNIDDSILGISPPNIEFIFENREDKQNIVRKNQDFVAERLSQGEKRALYLLNIIFDIENLKKDSEKEILFVIDDIADSFDYKNKYAIVEYLQEIIEEPNFYSIILTHNFDFFRTLYFRLDISQTLNWRFLVENFENNSEEIILKEAGEEICNPFKNWINKIENLTEENLKYLFSSMIFIRNLLDFSGNFIENNRKNKELLTNIIHGRKENLKFCDIENIFNAFNEKIIFNSEIKSKNIIKTLELICEKIDKEEKRDNSLETKIVLAFFIRMKTEIFLRNILNKDKECSSPLWSLINSYAKSDGCNKDFLKILKSVNVRTHENIHLNSFMYEPILDMDITELKSLYKKVRDNLK